MHVFGLCVEEASVPVPEYMLTPHRSAAGFEPTTFLQSFLLFLLFLAKNICFKNTKQKNETELPPKTNI